MAEDTGELDRDRAVDDLHVGTTQTGARHLDHRPAARNGFGYLTEGDHPLVFKDSGFHLVKPSQRE
jgi:hypothetical protein